jgi:hypothetical protein
MAANPESTSDEPVAQKGHCAPLKSDAKKPENDGMDKGMVIMMAAVLMSVLGVGGPGGHSPAFGNIMGALKNLGNDHGPADAAPAKPGLAAPALAAPGIAAPKH